MNAIEQAFELFNAAIDLYAEASSHLGAVLAVDLQAEAIADLWALGIPTPDGAFFESMFLARHVHHAMQP